MIGARGPVDIAIVGEGITGTPCTVPQVVTVDVAALSPATLSSTYSLGGEAFPDLRRSTSTAPALVSPGLAVSGESSIVEKITFRGLTRTPGSIAGAPDVIVAAGPEHVLELVNFSVGIWDKSGTQLQTFSLSEFFQSGSDRVFDPAVLFDAQSRRWFATAADFEKGSVLLAVSGTDNARGVWKIYSIDAMVVDPVRSIFTVPDVPLIGVSADKFAVAIDSLLLGGTSAGGRFWILNKAQLVSHASTVDCSSFGPDLSLNWVHPAHSLSPTDIQYLVSTGASSETASTAWVLSVSGLPPGTVTAISEKFKLDPVAEVPPDAIQPGTSTLLNTRKVGTRVETVAWYRGSLWVGLHNGCVPAGDWAMRSCLRLLEVETNRIPFTMSQGFNIGSRGKYYFYPALTVDHRGSVAVVFGFSSETDYPSVAVTGRFVNDPLDSWITPVTIIRGSSANQDFRYGDYFGAGLDPEDPSLVWVGGEYMPSLSPTTSFSLWSSVIAAVSVESSG